MTRVRRSSYTPAGIPRGDRGGRRACRYARLGVVDWLLLSRLRNAAVWPRPYAWRPVTPGGSTCAASSACSSDRGRGPGRSVGRPLSRRSDDAVEQRDVGIAHEPHQQSRPRRVGVQPLVELRCDSADLRQAAPRNRHDVVMLVVIADIERHLVRAGRSTSRSPARAPARSAPESTARRAGAARSRTPSSVTRYLNGPPPAQTTNSAMHATWTTMLTTVQPSSRRTRVSRRGRTMPWIRDGSGDPHGLRDSRPADHARLGRTGYARVELEIAHVAVVQEMVLGERNGARARPAADSRGWRRAGSRCAIETPGCGSSRGSAPTTRGRWWRRSRRRTAARRTSAAVQRAAPGRTARGPGRASSAALAGNGPASVAQFRMCGEHLPAARGVWFAVGDVDVVGRRQQE